VFFSTLGFIGENSTLWVVLGKSFYFCIDWRFVVCIIRLSRCFGVAGKIDKKQIVAINFWGKQSVIFEINYF